jgi:hypothetical protein
MLPTNQTQQLADGGVSAPAVNVLHNLSFGAPGQHWLPKLDSGSSGPKLSLKHRRPAQAASPKGQTAFGNPEDAGEYPVNKNGRLPRAIQLQEVEVEQGEAWQEQEEQWHDSITLRHHTQYDDLVWCDFPETLPPHLADAPTTRMVINSQLPDQGKSQHPQSARYSRCGECQSANIKLSDHLL